MKTRLQETTFLSRCNDHGSVSRETNQSDMFAFHNESCAYVRGRLKVHLIIDKNAIYDQHFHVICIGRQSQFEKEGYYVASLAASLHVAQGRC